MNETTVTLIISLITAVVAICGGIPAIILAWAKAKEATIAAQKAEAATRENLEVVKEVSIKVNGHWAEIEKRLTVSDQQNAELIRTVRELTATAASHEKDAAVAVVEKDALAAAYAAKELSLVEQAKALATPVPPQVIVVEKIEQVESKLVEQLDRVETTGEETNEIVKEAKSAVAKGTDGK